MTTLTPNSLSDFDIDRSEPLSETTISTIHTAVEKSTKKKYMIKECKNAAVNAEVVKVFDKEISRLTALSHVNIPTFVSSFTKKPHGYIIMQYTAGVDLITLKKRNEKEKITTVPCLTTAQLKVVTIQLVSVLDYLHSKTLPHYEIKPSNIIYCPNGSIKLLDFGSAKSLVSDSYVAVMRNGPEYLAPEVLSSRIATTRDPKSFLRADIWSLGATLLDLAIEAYTYDVSANDPWAAMEKLRTDHYWVLSDYLELFFVNEREKKRLWRQKEIADVREIIEMCVISNTVERKMIGDIIVSTSFQRLRLEDNLFVQPAAVNVDNIDVSDRSLGNRTIDISSYDVGQVLYVLKSNDETSSSVIKCVERLYELCCGKRVGSFSVDVNMSLFYANSGWLALLPLLSRFEDNHEILSKLFVLLMAIGQKVKIKSKIGDCGFCEAFVPVLKKCLRNELLAKDGCGFLLSLALNNKNCEKLGSCGGCEVVVSILTNYAYNEQIVEYSCGTILALALNNGNRVKLGIACCCEAVVASVNAYTKNKKIVEYGCGAILTMSLLAENRQKLISRGAYDIVMVVLQSFSDDRIITLLGLEIISSLSCHSKDFCLKLGLRGFCELVSSLLKLHVSDNVVAAQGCSAMKFLASIEENSSLFGTSGACETVLKAIKLHQRDPNVVREALYAISALSMTENNRARLGSTLNGSEDIISTMTIHLIEDKVLEAGCLAITNVAYNNEQNQFNFVRCGSCDVLIEVFKRKIGNPSIVARVFKALTAITNHPINYSKLQSSGGVYEVIIDAMKMYSKDPNVTKSGCSLISVLALDEENRAKLGFAGACEVVVSAIMAHTSNAAVVTEGCWALCNLAELHQNSIKFGACWGCEALISAMSAHTDVQSVAEAGCRAIRYLSRHNTDNKMRLGVCGGCEAVVSILNIHVNAEKVVEECFVAIRNLSVNDENNQKLGSCGACESVLAAVQYHLDISNIVEQGCVVIRNLSVDDDNSYSLNQSGCCEILDSVLAMFADNAGIVESAMFAKSHLMSGHEYLEDEDEDDGDPNVLTLVSLGNRG